MSSERREVVLSICRRATAHNYGQTVLDSKVTGEALLVQMSSWPRADEAVIALKAAGYDADHVSACVVVIERYATSPGVPRGTDPRDEGAECPRGDRFCGSVGHVACVPPRVSSPVPADEAARVENACEVMHDAYEAAAVGAGWETQAASHKPWADVPEANKATMRAAVRALLAHLAALPSTGQQEAERLDEFVIAYEPVLPDAQPLAVMFRRGRPVLALSAGHDPRGPAYRRPFRCLPGRG